MYDALKPVIVGVLLTLGVQSASAAEVRVVNDTRIPVKIKLNNNPFLTYKIGPRSSKTITNRLVKSIVKVDYEAKGRQRIPRNPNGFGIVDIIDTEESGCLVVPGVEIIDRDKFGSTILPEGFVLEQTERLQESAKALTNDSQTENDPRYNNREQEVVAALQPLYENSMTHLEKITEVLERSKVHLDGESNRSKMLRNLNAAIPKTDAFPFRFVGKKYVEFHAYMDENLDFHFDEVN